MDCENIEVCYVNKVQPYMVGIRAFCPTSINGELAFPNIIFPSNL